MDKPLGPEVALQILCDAIRMYAAEEARLRREYSITPEELRQTPAGSRWS